ncbi:hypothetical protein MWU65_01365 [Cellulophaga sp. F20128]|uniref:hypothetical protein n=1 Tax=Cellulophaga sp. F20128 TaxID=2926413 RepID=UPI001FF24ED0|nr:hypothetical protein [Cellulophaga sp. F20128]MCK0155808.1 hypothetical protein [Cellulophaga sp. F20128]
MKNITLLLLFFIGFSAFAQKMPVTYKFSEKYHDRYKYSNLQTIANDGAGGSILVRSYFTGLILKPRGYIIEHYGQDLGLLNEFNYKVKDKDFVNAFVNNGILNILFLEYNAGKQAYDYVVHQSPITNFDFTKTTILSIPSKQVEEPIDKKYYNREFASGFSTSILFNEKKDAFVISAHYKKAKDNQHFIHVFDADLTKLVSHDFSAEVEEKNYAFENVEITQNKKEVFLVAKAYYKKRRFSALERKFQYELIKVTDQERVLKTFDEPGMYLEALKPILTEKKLICIGFYSNRKDNRYNGLSYFKLDEGSLDIKSTKFLPFTPQFMADKFGLEEDNKEVKNLIFKNAKIASDGSILFNAEEYFITSGFQNNPGGSRVKITRYHYNDMIGAKLTDDGDLIWVRNINKSEVTQGDGAYASYSTLTKGNDTYFFISTASENPQLLNNERLVFRQGLGRNRNVFMIKLDEKGFMTYDKIIDDKEARLPLMVSKPLINKDQILFYAKRGSKKQLVEVKL